MTDGIRRSWAGCPVPVVAVSIHKMACTYCKDWGSRLSCHRSHLSHHTDLPGSHTNDCRTQTCSQDNSDRQGSEGDSASHHSYLCSPCHHRNGSMMQCSAHLHIGMFHSAKRCQYKQLKCKHQQDTSMLVTQASQYVSNLLILQCTQIQ